MVALPSSSMPTVDAIFAKREELQDDGWRHHLGASLLGEKCERSLWYSFRWATRTRHAGRMLRLFETGQLEEARFVADLRSIGVEVYEYDESGDWLENLYRKGRQIEVRDPFGHVGGSLDAIIRGIPEAPKSWHVAEFKTHNNKSFNLLLKDGVLKAKPRHYTQMQTYMHLLGVERFFYLGKNKDTDALYTERGHYDAEFAIRALAKGNRVVNSPRPPSRISEDPSWFECRFCDHHAVCFDGARPERHCRSCINSTPVEGGTWACEASGSAEIPKDFQKVGCPMHRYIPDLIAGRQTDVVGDAIGYKMNDGSYWTDEGPENAT